MSVPVLAAVLAAAIATGYLLGRVRPLYRAVRWANWEACGRRPVGWRLAAVWALLTTENLAIAATHPRGAWRAWRHHHDPPPHRSPAVAIRRTPADDAPEEPRP